MKGAVLGAWLGFACVAHAQIGDVFQSGGAPEAPSAAVQNLYQLTAQMIDNPSSGYDPKTSRWLQAEATQQQWNRSMTYYGNALTQQQRQVLVPCAAHLNTALDSAERAYRIQISQQANPPAQATVQKLKAKARDEFAMCKLSDVLASNSNGNPGPNTGGRSGGPSGGTPGGTPGPGQSPPIQGGVGKTPGGSRNPSNQGGPSGASPPLAAAADYTRGFADGMRDCFSGAMVAAGFMLRGDFVGAAKAMGLQPGQSVVLQELFNTKVIGAGVTPYDAGAIAGRRFCSYAMIPASMKGGFPRNPLVGRGGRIPVSRGYNFYETYKAVSKQIKDFNPTGSKINCGPCVANWARSIFGKKIEAAPVVEWTEADMEKAMGKNFMGMPLQKAPMLEHLARYPEGTVGVLSWENPKPGVRPAAPPTGPTAEYNPGHFSGFVKVFDKLQQWDPEAGIGPQLNLLDGWLYREMILGNGLDP